MPSFFSCLSPPPLQIFFAKKVPRSPIYGALIKSIGFFFFEAFHLGRVRRHFSLVFPSRSKTCLQGPPPLYLLEKGMRVLPFLPTAPFQSFSKTTLPPVFSFLLALVCRDVGDGLVRPRYAFPFFSVPPETKSSSSLILPPFLSFRL